MVVQSLSHVQLFPTPWTAAHPTLLSFTIAGSFLKFMSVESVMPSKHLIVCCHTLLSLQSFPASGFFSSGLALCIKWPLYWSFSLSISPSNKYSGLISFRTSWFDRLAIHGILKSSPAPQFKSINSLVLSLLYGPTLTSIHDYWENPSFDYMHIYQLPWWLRWSRICLQGRSLIPGSGRSPGKGDGCPLQHSCLGNGQGSLVGYSSWVAKSWR